MTTQAHMSKTITRVECWYEYSATTKEAIEKGHRRVDDADDPRWDGEMRQPPFRGGPKGYLQVAEVTRFCDDDGVPDMTSILRKKAIKGQFCHMNKAREVIRHFQERQAAGDEKPWDKERFYRDAMAAAEEAERDGRERDLAYINERLRESLGAAGAHTPSAVPPSTGGDKK